MLRAVSHKYLSCCHSRFRLGARVFLFFSRTSSGPMRHIFHNDIYIFSINQTNSYKIAVWYTPQTQDMFRC